MVNDHCHEKWIQWQCILELAIGQSIFFEEFFFSASLSIDQMFLTD